MSLDWLFGPRIQVTENTLTMRSLTLDRDAVRAVYEYLANHLSEVRLERQTGWAEETEHQKTIPIEQLGNLADWELRRLMIWADTGFFLDLRAGEQPAIGFQLAERREIAEHAAEMMLSDGLPRIHWKKLVPTAPLVLALMLIASWIWYAVDSQPPVSLSLAGSLLVLLACASAWDLRQRIIDHIGYGWPGHRVHPTSRQEIRDRRADRHANLRLSLVTLPLGAVLGAAVQWLFTR